MVCITWMSICLLDLIVGGFEAQSKENSCTRHSADLLAMTTLAVSFLIVLTQHKSSKNI